MWVEYFLTGLFGLVAAGCVRSGWRIFADEELSLDLLRSHTLRMPLIVGGLVFAAPLLLASQELHNYLRRKSSALQFFMAGIIAVAWCFIEGVFILVMVFG